MYTHGQNPRQDIPSGETGLSLGVYEFILVITCQFCNIVVNSSAITLELKYRVLAPP